MQVDDKISDSNSSDRYKFSCFDNVVIPTFFFVRQNNNSHQQFSKDPVNLNKEVPSITRQNRSIKAACVLRCKFYK